ncbi:unnamed protein product [Paramecium pentaurelia]|uniref:Uncharacterized protein n=1 Tax=Paramecium pentaurelia TaxID=43138 RepID=A0A8S1TCK6_9CILI|nr:unnamed protein product [Paramecium pentaurelia]
MFEDEKTLINIINNPDQLDEEKIVDLVFKLCNKKNTQLEYDGLTYCQLTGKNIGNQSTIKIDIKSGGSITVLKDKLKELIQQHCFINGIFEQSFSKIYKINILNPSYDLVNEKNEKFSSIEITDSILQQVYGKEEYQQIMAKIDERSKLINQNMDIDVTFICPIMKKSYLKFSEGINLQGQLYSLEGAILILKNHPEKLFSHQKEYLEKIQCLQEQQQLNKNQIKIDSIIFQCPITKNQYYTCLEGIKFEENLYSIEGLQQKLDQDIKQQTIDKNQNEINYLDKFKQGQNK